MKNKEIHIQDYEYKILFLQQIVYTAKLDPSELWIALQEFDAHLESVGVDFIGDPQFEALECLSYWSE